MKINISRTFGLILTKLIIKHSWMFSKGRNKQKYKNKIAKREERVNDF